MLEIDVAVLDGLLELLVDGSPLRDALLADARLVEAQREADPEGAANLSRIEALVDARRWELVALSAWLCRTFDQRPEDLPWLIRADTSVRGFDLAMVVLGDFSDDALFCVGFASRGYPIGISVQRWPLV